MTYLDTHVVVWLFAGDTDLIPARLQALLEEEDLYVSPMVELELQYLLEAGKISVSPRKVLTALASEIGLAVCGRPFGRIVTQALSYSWTRDPFDRVITAHAALTNSSLLTKDRVIRAHYRHALWA